MEKIWLFLTVASRNGLSKVDAAKAQSTVQAAFAGGVILTNADNAYMRHDANYTQSYRQYAQRNRSSNFYLAKPFVDHLKNNNDPTLISYCYPL